MGYLGAVHERARHDPGAVAFELSHEEGETRLSYGGLMDRVQRLGAALRRAGYGDGARIAICLENRPAWPVAYLATWYAGGVTVPLDPAVDEEVLARLLEHSGALACFTSATLEPKLRAACASMERPPLLLSFDAGGGGYWDGEESGAQRAQPEEEQAGLAGSGG